MHGPILPARPRPIVSAPPDEATGSAGFGTIPRVTKASKPAKLDKVGADAVDAARQALLELVPAGDVGEHLGVDVEGKKVVTHRFACTQNGYRGWSWSVTVARAPKQKTVTVDEIVLLPGEEAVLAPEWVPYKERIRPGDLSPGDLLPTEDDDDRLVPAFTGADELPDPREAKRVAEELGLGRPRVLSVEGRESAAQRWYDGDHGPESPLAQSAPGGLRDLRVPGQAVRPAEPGLRGLRQRVRQRRRQGGLPRPRLRRALGGPAEQEAAAPAAARAGPRRDPPRRPRDSSDASVVPCSGVGMPAGVVAGWRR